MDCLNPVRPDREGNATHSTPRQSTEGPHEPLSTHFDPHPPGEDRIISEDARRPNRRAVALFIAVTFGLMAVLSLPIAQFLPGPLRSLFGGIERILRPQIVTAQVHQQKPVPDPRYVPGAHPGAGVPPPPTTPAAGGGPRAGNTSGGGTAGGSLSPVVPSPGPSAVGPVSPGGGGTLKKVVSELDVKTVEILGETLRHLGPRHVSAQLGPHSDRPGATNQLIRLTAQRRLSDIPSTITPAELHWLLADLRRTLSALIEHAQAGPRHRNPPGSTASGGAARGRPASAVGGTSPPSSSLGKGDWPLQQSLHGMQWWVARWMAAHHYHRPLRH